jgi:hypothetical protein
MRRAGVADCVRHNVKPVGMVRSDTSEKVACDAQNAMQKGYAKLRMCNGRMCKKRSAEFAKQWKRKGREQVVK